MTDLPDLARKVSLALSGARGIRLSSDELDLFAAIGANDVLQDAAAKYLRDQCLRRSAQARSIDGGSRQNSGSTGTVKKTDHSDPRTLPSSGTTSDEEETEALQRAQRTLKKRKANSTGSTSNRPAIERPTERAATS